QTVSIGQVLGYVGNSGFSQGPHLHFEVRIDGAPVNPRTYLP
ncbi:MAG: M23 family metallopeptidase, partial [bacterium]|nr:M23 family metallopeptidase [bacterium]